MVWNGSGNIPEVRDGSGELWGGLVQVTGNSRRLGTGLGSLEEVRNGSVDPPGDS